MRFIRTICCAPPRCAPPPLPPPPRPPTRQNGVEYLTLPRSAEHRRRQQGRSHGVLRLRLPALPRFRAGAGRLGQEAGRQYRLQARARRARRAACCRSSACTTRSRRSACSSSTTARCSHAMHERAPALQRRRGGVRLGRARPASTAPNSSTPTARSACRRKTRRAGAMMEAYRIDHWPMLAVGGRYLTSPFAGQRQPCTPTRPKTNSSSSRAAGDGPPGRQSQSGQEISRPMRPRMTRVFITGASSGIGAALAARICGARRHAGPGGAPRASCSTSSPPACPIPHRHSVYALDVTDHAALARGGAATSSRTHGGADIVIANAGISHGTLTEFAADLPVFDTILATNVSATVATFAPFIATMKAQPRPAPPGRHRQRGRHPRPARRRRLQRVEGGGAELLRIAAARTAGTTASRSSPSRPATSTRR